MIFGIALHWPAHHNWENMMKFLLNKQSSRRSSVRCDFMIVIVENNDSHKYVEPKNDFVL